MPVEIVCTKEGLTFKELDVIFIELLRKIPATADPGESAPARARLYPEPAEDGDVQMEWREYVKPELRHLFTTANQTVRGDLTPLEKPTRDGLLIDSLPVPKAHFESWLSSLNQARLALAAKHGFSDAELAANETPSLANERDLSLFQIHFYGFIQECLVRELEANI